MSFPSSTTTTTVITEQERRLMQQQQAQLLFRQRQQQLLSRNLPPTPTLSSQGSPAQFTPAINKPMNNTAASIVMEPPPPPPPTQASAANQRPSMGQAVLRLLQFRDQLSPGEQAQDINFWNNFVDDFFTPTAIMKLTLVSITEQDKQQHDFDIQQVSIARIFHTHYACDLESMQLTTDQTMEYFLPSGMMLECPRSSLIYRYQNGTMVIVSGELSVLFNLDPEGILKIQQWKFIATKHDEYIARSRLLQSAEPVSKKKVKAAKQPSFHIPNSFVNSFGIPERIMALLKITDASIRLGEVAFFSLVTGFNPQDSLSAMSFAIQQQMSSYPVEPQQQQSEIDLLSLSSITPQQNNNMPTPMPNNNIIQQQQQQQHMQRLYQHNLRMQHQQAHALQLQQRQAMQRLQQPYTTSPISIHNTINSTPPQIVNSNTPQMMMNNNTPQMMNTPQIMNNTPNMMVEEQSQIVTVTTPTPRKRKSSIQKEPKKPGAKKGKKQQQQQQQQQQ